MDPVIFEEMVRRLQKNKGVLGVIVTNGQGQPIKMAIEKVLGNQYLDGVKTLEAMATALIRDINPKDGLRLMRIQSKKNEVVLYKEKDYMLILIHGPDILPSMSPFQHGHVHRHYSQSNQGNATD